MTLEHARSTIMLVGLSGATLAGAIAGPPLGSPDPSVMFAILFASLASSIAGFAFSAIAGAILFHLTDDHIRLVRIMMACSVANQTAMVWAVRNDIAWRPVLRLVAGGLCGVPIGAWILLEIGSAWFSQVIGVMLLAYGAYLLRQPDRAVTRPPLAWVDPLVGFAGGIVGAAAAAPSLPLTVWTRAQGMEKRTQRALCQPFILVMQVASFAALVTFGPARGVSFVSADLLCIPAGLFGTQIGMGCYRGLSNRHFAIAAGILLISSGLSFIL